MPKYNVKVPFSSTEYGRMWFTVEADSSEQAKEKAAEHGSDADSVKVDHNDNYEFEWDEAEVTER